MACYWVSFLFFASFFVKHRWDLASAGGFSKTANIFLFPVFIGWNDGMMMGADGLGRVSVAIFFFFFFFFLLGSLGL